MNDHEELCALLRAKATTDPSRIVEAIRARGAELGRRVKRRIGIQQATLAFGFLALLVCAIVFSDPVVIATCVLYTAAAISYAVVLTRHGRPAKAPAEKATMGEHFTYYRAELERERALLPRLAGYAVPLFGSAVLAYFGVRGALRARGMPTEATDPLFVGYCGVTLIFLAGGIVVGVRNRRKLGREMAALEG